MRPIQALIFLSLLFVLCVPCWSWARDGLVVSVPSKMKSYDPVETWSTYESFITASHCSPLVRIAENGRLEAHLASKWEVSRDFLSYRISLRKGVQFHDNSMVSAEDVAWSLSRHFWKSNSSSAKNTLELAFGKITALPENSILPNIEVVSRYKLKIVLPKPYIPFLKILSLNGLCVLKKGQPGIGSGPMMVNKIDTKKTNFKGWRLSAFENYYFGTSQISTINVISELNGARAIKTLVNGRVDLVVGSHVAGLHKIKGLNYGKIDYSSVNHFLFNPNAGHLANLEVRKKLGRILQELAWKKENVPFSQSPSANILPAGLLPVVKPSKERSGGDSGESEIREFVEKRGRPLKLVFVKRFFRESFFDDIKKKFDSIKVPFVLQLIDGPELDRLIKEKKFDVSHNPVVIDFFDVDSLVASGSGTTSFFEDPKYNGFEFLKDYRHESSIEKRNRGYNAAMAKFKREWVLVPGYKLFLPYVMSRKVRIPKTKFRNLFELWKIKYDQEGE